MNVFLIKTVGLCINGTSVVIAESEDRAKEMFNKRYGGEEENKIIQIIKVEINKMEKILFYDDGDK